MLAARCSLCAARLLCVASMPYGVAFRDTERLSNFQRISGRVSCNDHMAWCELDSSESLHTLKIALKPGCGSSFGKPRASPSWSVRGKRASAAHPGLDQDQELCSARVLKSFCTLHPQRVRMLATKHCQTARQCNSPGSPASGRRSCSHTPSSLQTLPGAPRCLLRARQCSLAPARAIGSSGMPSMHASALAACAPLARAALLREAAGARQKVCGVAGDEKKPIMRDTEPEECVPSPHLLAAQLLACAVLYRCSLSAGLLCLLARAWLSSTIQSEAGRLRADSLGTQVLAVEGGARRQKPLEGMRLKVCLKCFLGTVLASMSEHTARRPAGTYALV